MSKNGLFVLDSGGSDAVLRVLFAFFPLLEGQTGSNRAGRDAPRSRRAKVAPPTAQKTLLDTTDVFPVVCVLDEIKCLLKVIYAV